MTHVTTNRRQLCVKLNIGGECFNEYSKSKLIKLCDCNDKCKTDGSTLKELCLVRDGRLNIDIDLDNDEIPCFINMVSL